MIGARRLEEIRRSCGKKPVLVVGDLMLDEFLTGTVERISPEAPVPVLTYRSHHYALGGAANAARTLLALGSPVVLAGVVGTDQPGETLIAEIEAAGIDGSGVVTAEGHTTTLKTRIIAHTQQIVRIDRETATPMPSAVRRELLGNVLDAAGRCGALLVSDYGKGTISAGMARQISDAAQELAIPLIVDSKSLHSSYKHATVLTPNVGELARLARVHISSDRDLAHAAAVVLRRFGPQALLVTRAEAGMSLFASEGARTDIPALATEVHDVTGAGDTVTAVVALALACGVPLEESARLATLAAAVVVRKVGTAAPSWDEMAALAAE